MSQLVASIKQHKKFRQLASYSVQCLCKVITPPHVGWERNLKDAYDAGALEAITDVLSRHHGDEDVLVASTACLSSMATNPKYAAALVESGAIMGMLESIVKNPDQKNGVKESLQLLETIATNNPEVLLQYGGADAANRLIQAAPKSALIVSAAVRTLEKVNKVPGGSAALIECGAVKSVMSLVASGKDADVLESSFRLLERMCRATEHAEYIRNECNGMQVLSSALETVTNERLTKVGGRLLTKLASGSVSDLIGRLEMSHNNSEKEFLAGEWSHGVRRRLLMLAAPVVSTAINCSHHHSPVFLSNPAATIITITIAPSPQVCWPTSPWRRRTATRSCPLAASRPS